MPETKFAENTFPVVSELDMPNNCPSEPSKLSAPVSASVTRRVMGSLPFPVKTISGERVAEPRCGEITMFLSESAMRVERPK
jgi:hypothetical protein